MEREKLAHRITTEPSPDVASLLSHANTENRAGRELEAAEILERVLAIAPESIEARYGLATVRSVHPRGIADLDTALRLARGLLSTYPGSWDSHFVAAIACYHLGREEEFSRHWDAAMALMPATSANFVIARYTEALMRLEAGDFAAWPDYDYWHNQLPARRASLKDPAPRWGGDRLDGRRIFLHTTLDGFGDAFQMVRFIPTVKAMGGHVTLVCYPTLGRLLIRSGDRLGFDCIIAQGAEVPPAVMEHDVQAALMSLPAIFKTTAETIPDAHCLTVDEESLERWRPACSAIPGLRIGVCWAGSRAHHQDAFRSFRPAELAPLAKVPGVSLVNLQKGHGSEQLADISFPVVDLGPEYAAGDWLDTAAVVSQLDLVVTPDTAIAHLAGALAKPAWIALSRPSEWRWMRQRDDSPWYPAMRLFRQDKLGEWGPVFRRMAEALAGARHRLGQVTGNLAAADGVELAAPTDTERPPSSFEAWCKRALELCQEARYVEAEACFHEALALRPDSADVLNDLGTVLGLQSRLDEAAHYLERAIAAEPAHPRAHANLAAALLGLDRLSEAEAAARRALELNPDYPSAHNNLGLILFETGRLGDAERSYRDALRRAPEHRETLNNLANALVSQGRVPEALEMFDRALDLKPDFVSVHSNRLLSLHYMTGVSPSSLAEAHRLWERQHAAPLRSTWRPFDNDCDPERPLRLGFVSSDFWRHPVGYLIVRALEGLRSLDCETYCYYTGSAHDDLTERIAAASGTWRPARGLSDQALADQIRGDRVDLLFDLAGHTANHRLLVFARQPAPIQLTWLGYPGTTGLAAIDYLVADRFLVPPGSERDHRERIIRLPDGYACCDPPNDAPEVTPLPALARGHVTFGCFNNPAKVGPDVVASWAEILLRIPGSRLLLKYKGLDDPGARGRFVDLFAGRGIDPDRIELEGKSPSAGLLAAYGRVDLGLDPFPYSGCLTTCDALWMGVPVVTCPGDTFASRFSLSHLASVGLTETVARDLGDYVDRAVALAQDLPRLAALRAGLRPRMASSPLCDGDRLARNLLEALRAAWREWCTNIVRDRIAR
jgi:protein O-GlcNAc transferase